MQNLDEWNNFNLQRRTAMRHNDMDKLFSLITYKSANSTEDDGGNSLLAGLEYWDQGMLYNSRKNKVVVVKQY
jgi:serine/threonine-protein kinase RsbW